MQSKVLLYIIYVFCIYGAYTVLLFGEKHHFVQTAHDNSLVVSYGGQGSDPHLPSTKKNSKPSWFVANDPFAGLNAISHK